MAKKNTAAKTAGTKKASPKKAGPSKKKKERWNRGEGVWEVIGSKVGQWETMPLKKAPLSKLPQKLLARFMIDWEKPDAKLSYHDLYKKYYKNGLSKSKIATLVSHFRKGKANLFGPDGKRIKRDMRPRRKPRESKPATGADKDVLKMLKKAGMLK